VLAVAKFCGATRLLEIVLVFLGWNEFGFLGRTARSRYPTRLGVVGGSC
jgi:hypothetical protein